MVLLDSHIQECVDFVSPIFKLIAENTADVINTPVDADAFESELLEFNWEPLLKLKIAKSDFLIDLVLKRLITDLLSSEDAYGDDHLIIHMKRCSVILDFCFHSKQYREKPTSWIVVYFELFSTIFDMLHWPNRTLKFWQYVESRMDWFKMGNSLDPLPFGATNMISYKQPLYDKLRHWNDFLKMVQNNSSLNTPLDNIMSYKLTKFLSELLPLYEESNFNRSALISTKQGSGNPWNKTISSATKRDNSSENVFATDYNYVFDNLLTCPLEFAFRPTEHKMDLDKILSNLLDSIFETEEDFYRRIKNSQKKLVDINKKLNYQYPCEYEYTPKDQPCFLKNSSKLINDRTSFWQKFCSLKANTIDMLQPTLLDVSTVNPDTLYTQMMDTDNDFYRKQFLLQLYFTINMVRQIVTLPEIEKFYKLCYQKEKPSRSINFDNLDEPNRRRTSTLCNLILDGRINKFYRHRDPPLASLFQRLATKEKVFLEAKADGFKVFQNFQVLEHSLEPLSFNYSFKKFGFIEMGNKLINNVWKINTGLDKIKKPQESVKDLYDSLHEKFTSGEESATPKAEYDDKVIKEWQYLRSLRSQYLFEFNKVDENVGINGLFNPSLMETQREKKRELFQSILQETRRPHISKLEEARAYIAEKQKKKRAHEEELEENSHKKAKVELPKGNVKNIQRPTTNPEQTDESMESKPERESSESAATSGNVEAEPKISKEENKEETHVYDQEQTSNQLHEKSQSQESHPQNVDQAQEDQERVEEKTQEQIKEQSEDQVQNQDQEEFNKTDKVNDSPLENNEKFGQETDGRSSTDADEQKNKDAEGDIQDGEQASLPVDTNDSKTQTPEDDSSAPFQSNDESAAQGSTNQQE